MFLSLCTVTLGSFHSGLYRVVVFQIPYCKWLFSRVVYFTNGPSFSISRISISRMAAGDHIFLSISRFYISRIEPVPAKFLKYKSLENFHLYGILHRYLWGIMEWPSSQYRWFCMCQEVLFTPRGDGFTVIVLVLVFLILNVFLLCGCCVFMKTVLTHDFSNTYIHTLHSVNKGHVNANNY